MNCLPWFMAICLTYIFIYVCIDRSIEINNISQCILEDAIQNYSNCKWKSNSSVLNRNTSQQMHKKTRTININEYTWNSLDRHDFYLMPCVSFVFNISRNTGSISTKVTLYCLLKIIPGMNKDSILIWNINLNACGGIYVYALG